jgi:hypothetical protein
LKRGRANPFFEKGRFLFPTERGGEMGEERGPCPQIGRAEVGLGGELFHPGFKLGFLLLKRGSFFRKRS